MNVVKVLPNAAGSEPKFRVNRSYGDLRDYLITLPVFYHHQSINFVYLYVIVEMNYIEIDDWLE